jgi:hypothetical protein
LFTALSPAKYAVAKIRLTNRYATTAPPKNLGHVSDMIR